MPNRSRTAGDEVPGASPSADTIAGSSSANPFQDAVQSEREHPENPHQGVHPAITVGVVGLCRSGFPLALSLSHHLPVIGYDSSSRRTHKLRNLVTCRDTEAGTNVNERNLLITDDSAQLKKCNLIIITASAPVKKKGKQLNPLLTGAKIVGSHLQQGAIVVYDCILYPGTTEERLIPELEEFSSSAAGTDFHVGYSPGSIRQKKGQSASNHIKVVACRNKEILDSIEKVYSLAYEEVYPIQSIIAAEASVILADTEPFLFTALLDELANLVEYLVKVDLTGSFKREE